MKLKAEFKLMISKDGVGACGPGIIRLLKLIKENKSIKSSAKTLGLSYSKALKILNKTEKDFNINLIEKTRGGNTGGETLITEYGEKFIESYQMLYSSIDNKIDEDFKEYFSWLDEVDDDRLE